MSQAHPLSDSRKIPIGWANVHLHTLVESLESGISVGGEGRAISESENAVLMVSAVTSGRFQATEAKAVGSVGLARLKKCVKGDSVLVNRANGSADLVGSAVYVCSDYRHLFLSDKLWQIRPKAGKASGRFLGFLLSSPGFRRQVLDRSSGGTGMLNIASGAYLSIPVLAPPLPEQEAIAEVLNAWATGAERLKQLLDASRERKRGLMQQLLTGRKRFKGFGGQWRHCHLGEVVRSVSRLVVWDEKELYRLASVRRWCGGLFSREELYGHQIKVKKLQTVRTGDFLLSHIQAAYGAMAMVSEEFDGAKVSELYTILRPRDSKAFDNRYLGYLGQTKRMWHMAIVASNGFFAERLRLNFDLDEFLRLPVVVPPTFAEQAGIADTLEACDHEIELLEKQLDALKEQKRGLMQKLLSGEVRVKV